MSGPGTTGGGELEGGEASRPGVEDGEPVPGLDALGDAITRGGRSKSELAARLDAGAAAVERVEALGAELEGRPPGRGRSRAVVELAEDLGRAMGRLGGQRTWLWLRCRLGRHRVALGLLVLVLALVAAGWLTRTWLLELVGGGP